MQAPRKDTADPSAARHIAFGERIYDADTAGIAWRVESGAVRLDRLVGDERHFAGIALKGDVIGAETLLFGRYAFEAHALGDCVIAPWLNADAAPSGERLLQTLAAAERRAADALALRYGEAVERVRRLFLLLAEPRPGQATLIPIPGLKDMAEMTGLTVETVSRVLGRFKKSGLLQKRGRHAGLLAADAF